MLEDVRSNPMSDEARSARRGHPEEDVLKVPHVPNPIDGLEVIAVIAIPSPFPEICLPSVASFIRDSLNLFLKVESMTRRTGGEED